MSGGQATATVERIDDQLDVLVNLTGQGRVIAGQIGSELNDQNRMIGGLNDHMDGAQTGIDKANAAVLDVKASGGTCIAWVLALLLVIAIVVCLVIKK